MNAKCLFCDRGADTVPLISVEYRDSTYRICSQHLPILVHDPSQLAGVLPGAERLEGSDHKD